MSRELCVWVLASFGRIRFSVAAAMLAAAAWGVAQAQERGATIAQRIDGAFDIVPENPLELAAPLSRRALAERLTAEEERAPDTSPAGETAAPAATASVRPPDPSAASPETNSALSAAAPAESTDTPTAASFVSNAEPTPTPAVRVPRPRPAATVSIDSPLDLVAGAALPTGQASDPPETVTKATPPQSVQLARKNRPPSPDPSPAAAPPAADPLKSLAYDASSPPPGHATAARQPEPATTAAAPGACLAPSEVADRDGDFKRNATALADPNLCITQTRFRERRRPWTIQTVTSTRPGPLFAVMHDDEALSFDNAVQALKTYGGAFVTVDTGGKRNQDGIDPNRNFSDDAVSCSKLGKSASPKFTAAFAARLDPSRPVIALHNNFDGPVPTTGLGHVSMSTAPKDMRRERSKDRDGPLAGEHALVLLAAREPVAPAVEDRMTRLSAKGVNVVLEPVKDDRGDCSLSNYVVLTGHPDYFNITVHHDEAEKQRLLIDAILASFPTLAAR
jgi:hypothetical protein